MRRRYSPLTAAALILVITGVIWLRDPAWLSTIDSGFGPWVTERTDAPYRWIGGRASFFVPSDAAEIRIPIRLGRAAEDWPVVVSISIDGRLADRLRLTRNDWHVSQLGIPPPGSRHLRRIDLHVDRLHAADRGVQVGEVVLVR